MLPLLIAILLAALPVGARAAQEGHHTFWEVKGKHGTVYLLGSVHMLRPDESALPAAAMQAYAHSKGLVMELDLNDLSADQLLGSGLEQETLPEGQSLASALGADLYAKFQARAQSLGLDAEFVSHFQPWFAALLLQQLELAQSGFDTNAGVDMQFAQLAQADHKPIIGLETVEQQLGFFSHLSLEQQRQYLRSTLDEADSTASETAAVVDAWRAGDTAKLEQLLREGAEQSPELFHLLTTERNQAWLPKIDALLNGDGDYLVVVGAMHLIGHDGVVELLRQQGYAAVQR